MENKLTHFDESGNAIMVDVSEKEITRRTAAATGEICMSTAAFAAVKNGTAKKGDVLGVARVAGIMASKKCSGLIPLCHPVATEKTTVDFTLYEETHTIAATCTATCSGKTGVEMEALCGVNIALLTIYDMCKALDKGMVISNIHLVEKTGGRSGHYICPDAAERQKHE